MEKKTIFSDGVVPGITSGNETQYSRISIDGLKKVLGGREMKIVTRGSDGNEGFCWRYCYTMGEPKQTASTWLPSCYEHYHECTRNNWVANCMCV